MPLAGPAPLGPPAPAAPLVTADSWLPDPGQPETVDVRCRAASADALAELVTRCRPLVDDPRCEALRSHPMGVTAPGSLYPPPHSPTFDFDAAPTSAAWIDELAAGARKERHATTAPLVIGHSDWSARNVRLRPGAVVAVYDLDSLAIDRETTLVGQAALTWAATGVADRADDQTPDGVSRFLDEYGAARGRPLTAAERRAAGAAALYNLCYTARCEHAYVTAYGPLSSAGTTPATELLAREGRRFLTV